MTNLNNGIEIQVLRNGVKVLENNIENDFRLAQKILDVNSNTRDIDARSAYNEREYTHFENTYEINVQRTEDYKAFKHMLKNDKCYYSKRRELQGLYHNDKLSWIDYHREVEKLENCNCSKCTSIDITFEQWKNGLVDYVEYNKFTESDRTKTIKLGKYLSKVGFSKEVIDFYSAQIKDEKQVYLTITSAPQFVAGMSYFAEKGSWNGSGGTSCQDTRNGGRYSVALGGALADNMLHVAMLHESMEDINDMTDKLIARTLMRPVEVGTEWALVPINYYGNNKTVDMLHNALNQLNELLIYSKDVFNRSDDNDNLTWIRENISEGFEMVTTTEVNVYDRLDVDVSCECPACGGEGEISQEIEVNERYHDVTFDCPLCGGSGTYETEITVEYDEYVDVEIEETIYAYSDDASFYGFYRESDSYEFRINTSKIERDFKKFGLGGYERNEEIA